MVNLVEISPPDSFSEIETLQKVDTEFLQWPSELMPGFCLRYGAGTASAAIPNQAG